MTALRLVVAFSGLVWATGCGGSRDSSGRLSVEWTIDDSADPTLCAQGSAATFELTVYDRTGSTVGDFRADCQTFAMTVDLPQGSYSADARLLDPSNSDRTSTIAVNPFAIESGSDLSIALDFPSSSFL